jgi:hypothetical protein
MLRQRHNWPLTAPDPGDFSAQCVAELDHGGMEGLLGEGGPEFQVVASTAASVAAVKPLGDVDGETASPDGEGVVLGTCSVPLVAGGRLAPRCAN